MIKTKAQIAYVFRDGKEYLLNQTFNGLYLFSGLIILCKLSEILINLITELK